MKNVRTSGRSPLLAVLAIVALICGAAWLAVVSNANGQSRSMDLPQSKAAERPESAAAPLAGVDGQAGQRSAVAAEETQPQQTTPTQVEEPAEPIAVINGVVLDDFDRPFSAARVEVHERKLGLLDSRAVGNDGRFSAALYLPGTYSVRLDESSLPEGVLGPWRQETETPGAGSSYEAQKIVVPPEGGSFTAELRIFTAAVVRGSVIGPGWEPVEGVQVRVLSAAAHGQPTSMNGSTQTAADGSFEITRLRAGLYRLEVITESAAEEMYREMVSPLPQDIEILGAGFYDVGALQVGGGGNTVRGRVVDQDGTPFAGVQVIAYPGAEPAEGFMPYGISPYLASSVTDSSGFYELDKLPGAVLKVQAATDYMERPLGERRAAFWVEPLLVDTSGNRGLYEVPAITVPESRPFVVRGTIELDDQWAAQNRVLIKHLQIDVKLDETQPLPEFSELRPSFRHNQTVPIDNETGEFVWRCETPHAGVKLVISSRRGNADPVEVPVVPIANGSVDRTVRFPR